jgi:hypothetical protein
MCPVVQVDEAPEFVRMLILFLGLLPGFQES